MATALMTEEIYGDYTSRFPDVAVSVNKTRIIFCCKNKACKHVWAKEYRKVYRVMGERLWSKVTHSFYAVKEVSFYARLENGKSIRYEDDCSCPCCGKHGTSDVVVGSYSDHVCDSKCMSAKKVPVNALAVALITGSVIYSLDSGRVQSLPERNII